MIIKIEIDTREPLSNEDKALLRAIGYMDDAEAPAPEAPKTTPTKAAAAPAKKATAKKAAAAAPSTEPEPASEDGTESSTEADTGLRDAAVARASELLSSGERDRVMAALKDAGAGRVSEVPAENLQAFLDAITD